MAEPVRAIICGGRDYRPTTDDAWWAKDLLERLRVEVVVHGGALPGPKIRARYRVQGGPDCLAQEWAQSRMTSMRWAAESVARKLGVVG